MSNQLEKTPQEMAGGMPLENLSDADSSTRWGGVREIPLPGSAILIMKSESTIETPQDGGQAADESGSGAVSCSALCHQKDAGSQTIDQIMRWSIMQCDNPDVTAEIQQLGSRLKALISSPPNATARRIRLENSRGEYICRKCGLRQNSQHNKDYGF